MLASEAVTREFGKGSDDVIKTSISAWYSAGPSLNFYLNRELVYDVAYIVNMTQAKEIRQRPAQKYSIT